MVAEKAQLWEMRRIAAMLLPMLAAAGSAMANPDPTPAPMPPCASVTRPAAPAEPGPMPNVLVAYGDEIPGAWAPPDCLGWSREEVMVMIGTHGLFREPGGMEAVIARIARISEFTDIRYWSVDEDSWRPLITAAWALKGPDRALRRPDFAPSELEEGATLYSFQVEESPAHDMVYRVEVRERGPERFVVDLYNTDPLTVLLLPVVGKGDYRYRYTVERVTGDIYRFYSLLRVTGADSDLAAGNDKSFINRSVAVFRAAAGMDTDGAPPAAP